jgi:hypothetical protein
VNLVASAALAPVVAGAPIVLGAFAARAIYPGAGEMFAVIVAGLPVAMVLCMLATYFLQSDDLFKAKYSLLYCALLGGAFAAIATLGFLGLSILFWTVLAWGFLSGAAFRILLGTRANALPR